MLSRVGSRCCAENDAHDDRENHVQQRAAGDVTDESLVQRVKPMGCHSAYYLGRADVQRLVKRTRPSCHPVARTGHRASLGVTYFGVVKDLFWPAIRSRVAACGASLRVWTPS